MRDLTDKESIAQSINDKRQLDFDDLQRETSGQDVGRMARFLGENDPRSVAGKRIRRRNAFTLPFKVLGDLHDEECKMAEAQGFEPWGRSHARRFSRPVHSTTLPNLRIEGFLNRSK